MTATRDQRRRNREREKAAKTDAPTQRDANAAIVERMRLERIRAYRDEFGATALFGPMWRTRGGK